MAGLWAVWPERMFVPFDRMRVALHDAIENGDIDPQLTHERVDEMGEDTLAEWASDIWTFTKQRPNSPNEYTSDFDYSMNG